MNCLTRTLAIVAALLMSSIPAKLFADCNLLTDPTCQQGSAGGGCNPLIDPTCQPSGAIHAPAGNADQTPPDNPTKTCDDANTAAQKACDGGTKTALEGAALGVMGGIGDSILSRCQAMLSQINMGAMLTNQVAQACGSSTQKCIQLCQSNLSAKGLDSSDRANDREELAQCQDWSHKAVAFAPQMSYMAGRMSMSMQQCQQVVDAYNSGLCNDPSNAQNPLCTGNFGNNGTNGLTGTGNGSLTSNMPSVPTDNMGPDMNGNMYNGNPAGQGAQNQFPGQNAAANGMAPQGGSGYPGGAGGAAAQGSAQTAYNTNIGGGVGGSSSGYMPTGGFANNGSNGYGRNGGGSGMDLSCYLPGGKCDPNHGVRGPASLNSAMANGITGANDLSNFQKVTRVMNRKRAFLLPGG